LYTDVPEHAAKRKAVHIGSKRKNRWHAYKNFEFTLRSREGGTYRSRPGRVKECDAYADNELVGCASNRTAYEDIPTMVNSAGIRKRRKKNMDLSAGHPSDLKSFQLLGLNTRVSHAATVRVHTKKYLWAERCGGRRREFGRRSGLSVRLEDIGVWSKERRKSWRRGRCVLISLFVDTPHYFW
jgi:hypothetical protein